MSAPKQRRFRLSGFEYLALAMLVGLAVFFAIPHFIRARTGPPPGYVPCIQILRMLDEAKVQWALEHHRKPGDEVVRSEVITYIKGGLRPCPQGGRYTFGKVGEHPSCNYPRHTNFFSN
jgi:hypothetical protein